MTEKIRIGALARKSGVSIETIRYYEREGLILPQGRTASGYRIYGSDAVRRLSFVRQAKGLGFTLREVRELLEIRLGPESHCEDFKREANRKLSEIRQKIKLLQKIEKRLVGLTGQCANPTADLSECPILDTLEQTNHVGSKEEKGNERSHKTENRGNDL